MNEELESGLSYQEVIQYFSDQLEQLSAQLQKEQDDVEYARILVEKDRLEENIQQLKDEIEPGSAGDGLISEGTRDMSKNPDPH